MINGIDIADYLWDKIKLMRNVWTKEKLYKEIYDAIKNKRVYVIVDNKNNKIKTVGIYEIIPDKKELFFTMLASDISFKDVIRKGLTKILEDNKQIDETWNITGQRKEMQRKLTISLAIIKKRYEI